MKWKPNSGTPINPRQFLAFLRATDPFRDPYIQTKFRADGGENLTLRTVEKWVAHPRYTAEESVRKNPLEKFAEILEDCMAYGHDREARGIVTYFAALTGCALVRTDEAVPDRDTWLEEVLDDIGAGAAFHATARAFMEGRATAQELMLSLDAYYRELRETLTKCLAEKRGGG